MQISGDRVASFPFHRIFLHIFNHLAFHVIGVKANYSLSSMMCFALILQRTSDCLT